MLQIIAVIHLNLDGIQKYLYLCFLLLYLTGKEWVWHLFHMIIHFLHFYRTKYSIYSGIMTIIYPIHLFSHNVIFKMHFYLLNLFVVNIPNIFLIFLHLFINKELKKSVRKFLYPCCADLHVHFGRIAGRLW